jgi:polysaccharide pyruvyl transferase WcaK-like protein
LTVRAGAPISLVALGYQGYGNLGDEAILTGIERLFAGTPLTVSTVITGPIPEQVSAFPTAARMPVRRLVPTLQALRAIRRADGLLLAGGGLIHDHWATVLPRYLAWIVLARLLGRPVAWIGVGVGPLRRRPWRWMARLAARLSRIVVVRDDTSAGLLGRAARPIVAPDAALFNDPPEPPPARGTEVGVVVRDPGPGGGAWRDRLVTALAECVALLEDAGRPAVLLTMAGPADDSITSETLAAIRRRSGLDLSAEALGPSPSQAIARLASLDGLVTVRLHGLLLGLLAGTPTVAVGYDAKVTAVAAELGAADAVLDLADLAGPGIVEGLARVSTTAAQARVGGRIAALRSQREGLAARIAAVMAGDPR